MTAARLTIANALKSQHLFGPFFSGASWDRWRAVLKAAFAEPLNATELEAFREIAEREPPAHRVKEFVAVVGRGGGKDSVASFIAAFIAITFEPRKLRPGELAFVLLVAVDKDQAAIAYRYVRAFFEEVPALKKLVKSFGSDTIELKNKVVIQVTTNSYRSIRGRSVLAAIFDEVSFWRSDDSANPDVEVHAAIGPGLARIKGSMLILISSAHRRAGLIYERWKSCYGKPDDDTLVVRGTTRQFNSSFDAGVIEKALAADAQRAAAEYNSEWRDDLSSFIDRAMLERCVHVGAKGKPPLPGVQYYAFADPSSGRGDAFTASIAHRENHNGAMRVVIDYIYVRRAPFDPSAAINDVVTLLKSYHVSEVAGDDYATGFVEEGFKKLGLRYVSSKLNRSEIYLTFLPLVTSAQVLLLDHPKSIAEFAALERRAVPSGRDIVDHPKGAHDDIANAIAGAAVLASIDREQKVPLVAPIIIARGGDNSFPGDTRSTTDKYLEWEANGGGPGFNN